jgi:hypothetical protein
LKGEVAPDHTGPDIEHIVGDVVVGSHAIGSRKCLQDRGSLMSGPSPEDHAQVQSES